MLALDFKRWDFFQSNSLFVGNMYSLFRNLTTYHNTVTIKECNPHTLFACTSKRESALKGKWETLNKKSKHSDIFLETRLSYKRSQKTAWLRAAYFALFIKRYLRYVKVIRMGWTCRAHEKYYGRYVKMNKMGGT